MTTSNRWIALPAPLLLGLSALGCTAETAEEFKGTPTTLSVPWTSGKRLDMLGDNGEIRLEQGNPGVVQVTFKPFAFEGYTNEDKAQEAMREHVTSTLVDDGRIVAQLDNDGVGNLGGHMIVYVPPEFDSTLHIESKNGEVEVDYVGAARQLEVKATGAGDCLIAGAPTIVDTNVVCGFGVRVNNVSDRVVVRSTGIGDVTVGIASVSSTSSGGDIRASSGDVNLTLPAAGGYSVQATASAKGAVNEGTLPSACTVNPAASNSKTVSCGSGPNFLVVAGEDSSLADNVNLSYR